MYVSVSSGSQETKIRVCPCGNGALHNRGLHHSSGLSLPPGLALGVGLHSRVNTTLTLPLCLYIFYLTALETTEPLEVHLHSFTICWPWPFVESVGNKYYIFTFSVSNNVFLISLLLFCIWSISLLSAVGAECSALCHTGAVYSSEADSSRVRVSSIRNETCTLIASLCEG